MSSIDDIHEETRALEELKALREELGQIGITTELEDEINALKELKALRDPE